MNTYQRRRIVYLVLTVLITISFSCHAQSEKPKQRPGRQHKGERQQQPRDGSKLPPIFLTDVPDHPFDIILGRPADTSVTVSILTYQVLEGYTEYGSQSGIYPYQTETLTFTKGKPVELLIPNLQPDTQYYYRFRSRDVDRQEFEMGDEYSFHSSGGNHELRTVM